VGLKAGSQKDSTKALYGTLARVHIVPSGLGPLASDAPPSGVRISASLAASEVDVRVWATAAGACLCRASSLTCPGNARRCAPAIEAVGATAVMFEDLGAQDVSAEQAYLSGVRSSEVYVGCACSCTGKHRRDGRSSARPHPECTQLVHD